MPMYRFDKIYQGVVNATQDVECTDDEAALNEAYDGMDPLALASKGNAAAWIQVHRIDPRTSHLTPLHFEHKVV